MCYRQDLDYPLAHLNYGIKNGPRHFQRMPLPVKKKKAFYALGALVLFGAGLAIFAIAAEEQSIRSSGLPEAEKISLEDLITRGPAKNRHIDLTGFYFGRQYIYTTKLVQFREVYVPVFPQGQMEEGNSLRVLVWIRNDHNSNEPLIESQQDLDRLVADFNRHPSISGVLRKPTDQVRTLAAEAYPQVNRQSLLVLWARHFPTETSVDLLWGFLGLCLLAAGGCVVAYKRVSHA